MSATVIALATTLVIVLVIASVLVALLYTQLRQRRAYSGAQVDATPLTPGFGIFNFIPPWHPAAQITPFGSSPQAPVFSALPFQVGSFSYLRDRLAEFEPGTNMRIAHRNSQGGWEFFDSGLPENDKLPRPQSVRSSIFTRSTRPPPGSSSPSILSSHWTSGHGASTSRELLTADLPSTAPPPPAYCKDDKH